jgi:hypothetical protein
MFDMNHWTIGLAPWIIIEGDYDHFKTGQHRRFAAVFDPLNLSLCSGIVRSAVMLGRCRAQVTAEVTFKSDSVWVLNLGDISAYNNSQPPSNIEVGQFLQGDIGLGIDPCDYSEYLHDIPGIPPLVYEWEIERIETATAPYVETIDKLGQKMFIPDESKFVSSTVDSTGPSEDQRLGAGAGGGLSPGVGPPPTSTGLGVEFLLPPNEDTSAWEDHDCFSYILHCRKLDSEPTYYYLPITRL